VFAAISISLVSTATEKDRNPVSGIGIVNYSDHELPECSSDVNAFPCRLSGHNKE
jgi:hypothetical protein